MPPAPGLNGVTLRQIAHVSVGGSALRVRVSNRFGNGPLVIGGLHVAVSRGADSIDDGTDRALTFGGRPDVTVPAGGVVLSDPVSYDVPPLGDLALTMYVAEAPSDVTGHPGSRTTSYLQRGEHLSAAALPGAARTEHWYLLSGIDVVHPHGDAVVVLGNSIADGRGSGTNRQDRWPDDLARRLQANHETRDVAVLNAGIGGGCVLRACLGPPGLERLDRDVLDQAGARWVIVSEGVNDIGGTRGAAAAAIAPALIAGYRQIIARAHARGLRVYGATILPFAGSFYDSPEHEKARHDVNAWIRTSGAFDAVLDLAAAMRDSVQPDRLRADLDSGDHLHPNERGYHVMADAIDLHLLQPTEPTSASDTPSLRHVFHRDFLIGAAIDAGQIYGRDSVGDALILEHFDAISPENVLKWAFVHPRPGVYDFTGSDRYVAFGERHGLVVIGHTLVWHSQTPRWVFQDDQGRAASRDALLARLRDHIFTVVGRYRGRIRGWDVCNEVLADDGSLRHTPWLDIIGPDYIVKAYEWAHEADPGAELYYNDYSLESPAKRDGALRLVRHLLSLGIPVKAVGLQEHEKLDWPSPAAVDSTIAAFAALGVRVNVTELDVDVLPRAVKGESTEVMQHAAFRARLDPYAAALPDSVQQRLARRYAELFRVFVRHHADIDRVTFWGVRDGDSWLNNWPVRGRTNYPLLFDRRGRPKPAFRGVVRAAGEPGSAN